MFIAAAHHNASAYLLDENTCCLPGRRLPAHTHLLFFRFYRLAMIWSNGMLSSRQQDRSAAEGGSKGLVSRNALGFSSMVLSSVRGGEGGGEYNVFYYTTQHRLLYDGNGIYCCAAVM